MPNTCDIIISTGTNKGKLCRDINKYCRHKVVKCPDCGKSFGHKSSYERHRQKAHDKQKAQVKKKVVIVKKDKLGAMQQEIDELREELKQHREAINERVTKVEQKPQNIIVIGDEKVFWALVNRMGEHKAMSFLLNNIHPRDCINIVEKMYLEGVDKMQYPIACADNHKFRYLSTCGDIIDDRGGKKIVSKLENEIHSAIIEANNRLIDDFVTREEKGQASPSMFTVYDIGAIQQTLKSYRESKDSEQFRDDLAKRVYNTEHPFFKEN